MKIDHDIEIKTEGGVYAPSDDSFLLLEALDISAGKSVLEIGTGSGIIALHCAKALGAAADGKDGSKALVTAIDIDPAAVEIAKKNAIYNNLALDVRQGDLFDGIDEKFDIVIFNPPYLSSEGAGHLSGQEKRQVSGGRSGAELSLRFLRGLAGVLKPDGCAYLLVSSESQKEILAFLSENFEFAEVKSRRIFFEELRVLRIESAARKA